jgi:hypothetical protein
VQEEEAKDIILSVVKSLIQRDVMLVVDDDVCGGKTALNPEEVIIYLANKDEMFANRYEVDLPTYLDWKEWVKDPMNFGIGPDEYAQEKSK